MHDESQITQNTVFAAALCELLYYTETPAKTWIERKIRAREIAENYKKYAGYYPEMLEKTEKHWAAEAGMKKSTNMSAAAAICCLPCAYVYDSLEQAVAQTELACGFLYNTDTAKSCAKTVTAAVFLLNHGTEPNEIADKCAEIGGIDLSVSYDEIRDRLITDREPKTLISAAFAAFEKSYNFESAVRFGCACGTQAHIIAAVSGAMAQAHYRKIPTLLKEFTLNRLDEPLKRPINRFSEKYCE
jgi:ADP-ribosylglycohydrolase